jgi:hypothetical protein
MSVEQVLLDIAPETANLEPTRRANLIIYATKQTNFGCGYIKELAIAYLAAHMNAVSTKGGASGSVTSEKEGDLARSFGGPTSSGPLGATGYGQEYLRLRNKYVLTPRTRQVTIRSGC